MYCKYSYCKRILQTLLSTLQRDILLLSSLKIDHVKYGLRSISYHKQNSQKLCLFLLLYINKLVQVILVKDYAWDVSCISKLHAWFRSQLIATSHNWYKCLAVRVSLLVNHREVLFSTSGHLAQLVKYLSINIAYTCTQNFFCCCRLFWYLLTNWLGILNHAN